MCDPHYALEQCEERLRALERRVAQLADIWARRNHEAWHYADELRRALAEWERGGE
jgi:hypothetical protein